MRIEDVEPMDENLRAFLRSDETGDDVPAAAEGRVLARLAASLPIVDAGIHEAEPGVLANVPKALIGGVSATKIAVPVAVALLVGGGVGVTLDRIFAPERVRVVYVERPVPSASATTEPSRDVDDLSTAPTAKSARTAPMASVQRTPRPGETLIAESRVLDAARASFASGDYAAALATLDLHAAKYPNGQLAEEREALAIRALATVGRVDDARARNERFRERYPGSLMQPAVDGALQRR